MSYAEGDQIKVSHEDLNVLLAEGTKFKKLVPLEKQERKNRLKEKLGLPIDEESNRGEIKIVMGISHSGKDKKN